MSEDSPGAQPAEAAGTSDDAITTRFGYRPELRRSLGFITLFAISFSGISITTSIFLNYGFGLASFGPASLWVWPVVGLGQIILSLVVAEIGTRMPLAGYAYQWTARLMSSGYAWFVAFAALLYLTVGLAAVAYEVNAPLLLSEFGDDTPSKNTVLLVTLVLLAVPSGLNIISVRLAARVNAAGVFAEIIGSVVFALVLIALFVFGAKHVPHGAGILFSSVRVSHNPVWYSLVLSGLVGAFTLVGWEFSADLGEEAVGASRLVPRAMIVALVGSVLLGLLALIGFSLAIPNVGTTEAAAQPILVIGQFWLGSALLKVFIAFVIFAIFALNVSGAAGQSRLAYSLARDNMLPFSRYMARVDPHTQTPITALLVFGILNLAAAVYGWAQPDSFGTLVGATALLPFIIYTMVLIAYLTQYRRLMTLPGNFSLGKFGRPVAVVAITWTIGVCVALSAPAEFHGGDRVVVAGAAVAALWYLLVLRRRISSGQGGTDLVTADEPAPTTLPGA